MTCTDNDGYRRQIRVKGNRHYYDSDGGRKCCRNRGGYITCSDRDHNSDWYGWDEAVEMPSKNPGWWSKSTKVNCGREWDGEFTCDDGFGNRHAFKKVGKKFVAVGGNRYCRKNQWGYMTCTDNDRNGWYSDYDEAAEMRPTGQSTWWTKSTKVRCGREFDGEFTCDDDYGNRHAFRKVGKKFVATRGNRFCRKNAWGYMTCTDNDRNDFWSEEEVEAQVATPATPAAKGWW